MRDSVHRFSPARTLALAISLSALLHGFGCGPSDPLDKVRALQDQKSDYRGSIEPLRKLIQARPDDPEVQYRYGRALLETGDSGLAVWSLKKSIESPDWLEKSGLTLVAALNAQGAHDEALAVCNRILEQKPDLVPALLMRAGTRMLSRRGYDQVLADADRVLELEPDNQDALAPRVVALLGLERVGDARAALEQLESNYRDEKLDLHGSPALCLARATFAKESAQFEEQKAELEKAVPGKEKSAKPTSVKRAPPAKPALGTAEQRYEACLETFPAEQLVVYNAVDFFDGIGRVDRSDAILRRAIELAAGDSSYRVELALRLAGENRVDDAKALLRQGTEVASPALAAEAWAAVASFDMDHGELDEAIEAFGKARQLVDLSQNPQLLLAYADALVIAKRFDEAEKLVEQMKVPAHQSVVRARIELERGNPAAALKLFEEGARVWPNNAESRYYAAIAAEQLGDFARAVEEYRYAMRIDVTATDAYLRQARLQEAARQYEAALSTLDFEPGGRPEELAAGLLEMRILARLGQEGESPQWLRAMLAQPRHWGAAVAALGEGVRERSGPKAAVAAMKAAKLDLTDPVHVEGLAAIVEDLAAIGKAKEGLALVDAGLRKHPDAAALLAVRGRALQLAGAPAASARESFERALAIDASNARALVGMARLEAAAGSKEAALALYDRALAADESDRAVAREAASLLVGMDRSAEAEERLAGLLRDHPYDAAAARALAELRLGRGAKDERTLELAKRAVEFGGGAEAEALLERITPRA